MDLCRSRNADKPVLQVVPVQQSASELSELVASRLNTFTQQGSAALAAAEGRASLLARIQAEIASEILGLMSSCEGTLSGPALRIEGYLNRPVGK